MVPRTTAKTSQNNLCGLGCHKLTSTFVIKLKTPKIPALEILYFANWAKHKACGSCDIPARLTFSLIVLNLIYEVKLSCWTINHD